MSFSFLQKLANQRAAYSDTPKIPNLPRSAVVAPGTLQQSYRFILQIDGLDVAYITNVSRPSYVVSTEAYKLLNWSFNYPTELKWNPITFSVREVYDRKLFNTVAGVFLDKLGHMSWANPNDVNMFAPKDLDKRGLINGLGPVRINMLDDAGTAYESWEIFNAYITEMKSSELSYSSDALTNIDITLSYDFAKLHRHVARKPDNYASLVTDSPAKFDSEVQDTAEKF